jgi:hypothetical protein
MTNALVAAAAHGSTIPSPLTIIVAIAAAAYVLWSRAQGRPLKARRMIILPAALAFIGITDLTGSNATHLTSKDIAFLVVSIAISAALGAARGATIELYPKGGELWQRYKRNTIVLWILLIGSKLVLAGIASSAGASAGGGTNSLLLSLGVSLLAEAAIVGPRALSTGVPFATNHQAIDRDQYRPAAFSAPVSGHAVDGDTSQQRPMASKVSEEVQQPNVRRNRGRRHQHSGPIHRLVGGLIEAQAQQRDKSTGRVQ